jgi:hypothetical protein
MRSHSNPFREHDGGGGGPLAGVQGHLRRHHTGVVAPQMPLHTGQGPSSTTIMLSEGIAVAEWGWNPRSPSQADLHSLQRCSCML